MKYYHYLCINSSHWWKAYLNSKVQFWTTHSVWLFCQPPTQLFVSIPFQLSHVPQAAINIISQIFCFGLLWAKYLCHPQYSYIEISAKCNHIWRLGLWDIIRFILGRIKAFKRKSERSLSPWVSTEENKEAVYKPGTELSLGTKSAGTLNLDFPTSRTETKFLLCKPPCPSYFVTPAWPD